MGSKTCTSTRYWGQADLCVAKLTVSAARLRRSGDFALYKVGYAPRRLELLVLSAARAFAQRARHVRDPQARGHLPIEAVQVRSD